MNTNVFTLLKLKLAVARHNMSYIWWVKMGENTLASIRDCNRFYPLNAE